MIIHVGRRRRDDPHHAHIEDKELAAGCDLCLHDADEFGIAHAELPMVLG